MKEEAPGLAQDTTGSVLVEYTVLLVVVAMGSIVAIAAIGPSLWDRYRLMKMLIGLPIP